MPMCKQYKSGARLLWLVVGIGCLAACANKAPLEYSPDEQVFEIADASRETLSKNEIERSSQFAQQNPVYAKITRLILENNPPASLFDLARIDLERQAFGKSLYPTLTPSGRVSSDGTPLLEVGARQVIYSNGRFRAGAQSLRADEVAALARYQIEVNTASADGLGHYIDIAFNNRLITLSSVMIGRYQSLAEQSQKRIRGGVGDESELASFQLKLLEERAELNEGQAMRGRAQASLSRLTGGEVFSASPPRIKLPLEAVGEPPQVLRALARREQAVSTLQVAQARRRPELALEARSGIDISSGDLTSDVGLVVGVELPIRFGDDLTLAANRVAIDASAASVASSRRNVDARLAELTTDITGAQRRLFDLNDLVNFTGGQLDTFQDRFLSGAISIEEALSLLGTYKRTRFSVIETQTVILRSQIEIAQIRGYLSQ